MPKYTHEDSRKNAVLAVSVAILRGLPTRNVESFHASLTNLRQDLNDAPDPRDQDQAAYELYGVMRTFCDLHMPVAMDDAEVTIYDWPLVIEACETALSERHADAMWILSLYHDLSDAVEELVRSEGVDDSNVTMRLGLIRNNVERMSGRMNRL